MKGFENADACSIVSMHKNIDYDQMQALIEIEAEENQNKDGTVSVELYIVHN